MPSVQMPNGGLLSGLARGIESGVDGYMAAKKMQRDDNTQKMLMMQHGLITTPDGGVDFSPEEKMKRSQALQAEQDKRQLDLIKTEIDARGKGLLLNKGEGGMSLEREPGYVDQDRLLKNLQIRKAQQELEGGPKYTEGERNAATYAQRMEDANSQLQGLIDEGYDPSKAGNVIQRSRFMPEMFKSENPKLMEQAERNFLTAVLRKESGATISPSEQSGGEKQYFPREGDTPQVLAQKARNREVALAGMQASAGGASNKISGLLAGGGGGKKKESPSDGGLIKKANAADDKKKRYQELLAKRNKK